MTTKMTPISTASMSRVTARTTRSGDASPGSPRRPATASRGMTVGEAFDRVVGADVPIRLEAWDGSVGGDPDGRRVRLTSPRGLNHLLTAPGSVGLVRAYLMGDLVIEGMDEANPYDVVTLVEDHLALHLPRLRDLPEIAALVARHGLRPPELPPQEVPGRWRRLATGLRHGRRRDAEAISHHYDVSNTFYEHVLGPSMTYTCACYPTPHASLEQAQAAKYDLVARKLGLEPGMRLLDVGCGWGGMVRHAVANYGVTALGVTLSRQQAEWAQARIREESLEGRAEVRHGDYRDVAERGFDAVS